MRIKLNTDICPIVIPDTYGTGFCYEVTDDMWEDFKGLLAKRTGEKIKTVMSDLNIPFTNYKADEFLSSPRFYNFGTDWINFEFDVSDDYVEHIRNTVREHEGKEFFDFAESRFGSYDGFISFMPYEMEKFYNTKDNDKVVAMWIMYQMNEEFDIDDFQREFLDDIEEYCFENGYMGDDEDERI